MTAGSTADVDSGSSSGAGGRGRLAFLDALRGVAAVAVAANHGAEVLFAGWLRWEADWFSPGRFGVCAFFLVSGFVIPISLERAGGLRAFAIGRAARLYPLYWLSLAAVLVVSAFRAGAVPTDFHDRLPWSAVVDVTMAQELVGVPHAIGLYYTLTIELLWYGICAALFAVGWLGRTEVLAWAAIAGLAVVGLGGPLLLDHHVPFSTGFYLVTMLVGTAAARHAAGTLDGRRLAAIVAAVGALAVAGAWADYVRTPNPSDPEVAFGYLGALLPWVVAYLAFFVAYGRRDRQASMPRGLLWLGIVSYSIYLLHPVLLPFLPDIGGGPWVRLVVLVVATVAIAGVTQRFVEAPGQALGRRWRARLVP